MPKTSSKLTKQEQQKFLEAENRVLNTLAMRSDPYSKGHIQERNEALSQQIHECCSEVYLRSAPLTLVEIMAQLAGLSPSEWLCFPKTVTAGQIEYAIELYLTRESCTEVFWGCIEAMEIELRMSYARLLAYNFLKRLSGSDGKVSPNLHNCVSAFNAPESFDLSRSEIRGYNVPKLAARMLGIESELLNEIPVHTFSVQILAKTLLQYMMVGNANDFYQCYCTVKYPGIGLNFFSKARSFPGVVVEVLTPRARPGVLIPR